MSDNLFAENTLDSSTATTRRHGGALAIVNRSNALAKVTQSGNEFDQNTIGTTGSGDELGGGGEWIAGTTVDSTDDTFTSNRILDPGGEGGGIGVEGLNTGGPTDGVLNASNLVADGNSLAAGGIGAGIYAGSNDNCTIPDCPSTLVLDDSTVAGNCVDAGTGSSAPGIAGSGLDMLTLRNSIVYNAQATLLGCTSPITTADVTGFTAPNTTVTSSDLCAGGGGGGGPVSGTGNICADPLLLNPHVGDFHETSSSPTIDAGNSALVPAAITTDLDGEARIAGTAVDMGADEVQPAPPGGGGGGGTPPPVVDTTKPVFRFLQRVLTVDRRGRVKIKLRCTENTRCIGTLALTTAKPVIARKRKAKRLRLGSAHFNVAGNKTSTITLKLSRRARKLLARKHSLRLVETVSGRDTAGNAAKAKRTVTVRKPRPKHRKRH